MPAFWLCAPRPAGVSISAVTQRHCARRSRQSDTDRWLDRLERLAAHEVHEVVIRAVDEPRDEFGA